MSDNLNSIKSFKDKKIAPDLIKQFTKQLKGKVDEIKEIQETYKLIHKLSLAKKFKVEKKLVHRTLFNSETLPMLGNEYWWFLFIGQTGEKPIQLMFLIFRKHGKDMLFNGKKMQLQRISKNKFKGVTACWVWDGKKLRELGDTNAITTIDSKKRILKSVISEHKVTLKGSFPKFEFNVGDVINLKTFDLKRAINKDAAGVYLPPFGMGWVDAFSKTKGTVFGKEFDGIGHLQKVVGITTSGCFNWGNIFFKSGSSFSFFGVRPEKKLKNMFHTYVSFYNHKTNKVLLFKKPKLAIVKKGTKNPEWVVSGSDKNNGFKIHLKTYMKKKFKFEGGGWQVYEEYGVSVKKLNLTINGNKILLKDLGKGIGTFEDAYGFVI